MCHNPLKMKVVLVPMAFRQNYHNTWGKIYLLHVPASSRLMTFLWTYFWWPTSTAEVTDRVIWGIIFSEVTTWRTQVGRQMKYIIDPIIWVVATSNIFCYVHPYLPGGFMIQFDDIYNLFQMGWNSTPTTELWSVKDPWPRLLHSCIFILRCNASSITMYIMESTPVERVSCIWYFG